MIPVAMVGSHMPGMSAAGYNMTDALFEELSRQLSTVTSRRFSRGSNGQLSGNSMRVMKPRSANNSPRSTTLQDRRKAILNDGQLHQHRARPAIDNAYMPTSGYQMSSENMPGPSQLPTRPLSWHPSSQQAQPHPHASQQQQQQTELQQPHQQEYQHQQPLMHYPFPSYTEPDLASLRNLPPTPAVYSGYTSPASAFSPLSLPYSGYEQQQQSYFSPTGWTVPAQQQSSVLPLSQHPREPDFNQRSPPEQPSSHLEWNSFVAHGFDRCTAPPTPQDFIQAQQPEPRLQSEESIPYEPLEEESDGEILYGLGLYDTPEKAADPQIDYHRSVVSSLLGSAYTYPEPTGKGLKLEDAWEPPADSDEDSQDGSDDAEGEEQDD
ncbi:hypothetical protein QBC33DRAFT_268509 [Phialemonium atrogriseum]|uniref:Uncharacterized protein n=1 Tax=Phialemonium atrogriseum TaxID=1093897 RepID=A0AAJ0FPN9_9PEZI|nr:uncharacterized protein QBC33DRAFT_268509 [Phialemonium atrogriseum]KAK1770473.1 hypothetical protein QBC33DRAFT_268509 [Phialemonium atrogriseum]